MPKIAANLTMLFTELPFPERFRAAARCGFTAVEHLFPYQHDMADLKAWLDENGLEQVLINMPAGDWQNGERGLCCLPGREAEFEAGIGQAIEYAKHLDCPRVHVVAGRVPADAKSRAPYEDTYRRNLAWAADRLAEHGLMALVESINGKYDVPGFFVQTTSAVRAILAELGRPNLKLQFDAYHVQIMQGDLVHNFRADLRDIGHIQIGNPPDRHEPDVGEINYPYFFQAIDDSGYDGWVACEYKPKGDTAAGLGWARPYGVGG
jgi:hydroxypyruvate isomerase